MVQPPRKLHANVFAVPYARPGVAGGDLGTGGVLGFHPATGLWFCVTPKSPPPAAGPDAGPDAGLDADARDAYYGTFGFDIVASGALLTVVMDQQDNEKEPEAQPLRA